MTPPKMVPCAFVSRGIIRTRIAGSSHFGRISTANLLCALRAVLLLEHLVVHVDLRALAQPLQERRAKAARLLLTERVDERGAVLLDLHRARLLLLDHLERDGAVARGH